ncbi:MAG: hypothetical protein LBH82_03560 [Bacteroidales bacterium]|jgi:hypothetical protein|nr:hypothetical protein [Bacteroidales bacterium]
MNIIELLNKVNRKNIWDEEPVFCFTSDMDWASEAVLSIFFQEIPLEEMKLTTFVTHLSEIIENLYKNQQIERGIHPNFLFGSSHGNSFREVIETCKTFSPEAVGSRSHRLFQVTDTAHLLKNEYGFLYSSNVINVFGTKIKPLLHESQLIEFPVFFEDGTFLYNDSRLKIEPYLNCFETPGLKIISFHPMNIVFNTPCIQWMRALKDSMTREAFHTIDADFIQKTKNNSSGIGNILSEIVNFVRRKNYPVLSLNEIYYKTIE